MTTNSSFYRDPSINPSRRNQQRAIYLAVDKLFLNDKETFQEMSRRLEAAGLSYTPAECAEAATDVKQRVAMAAANNAAEGFKLTPQEIEEVTHRAFLRSGLTPIPR